MMSTILYILASPLLFLFSWISFRLLYCVYNYQVYKNKLGHIPAVKDPFARLKAFVGTDSSTYLWQENTELAGVGNAFVPLVLLGPYMDMGRPAVMVNSPELIRDVSVDKKFPKLRAMYDPALMVLGDGLVTMSGDKWKLHHEKLGPLFYHNEMKQYANHMTANADELISVLENSGGKDVDCIAVLSEATLSVFVDCIFSRNDFDPKWTASHLHRSGSNLMVYALTEFLFGSTLNSFFPWTTAILNTKKTLHEKVAVLCERARKSPVPVGTGTFVERLVAMKDKGKPCFSDEEIADEAMTFLVAGYDTTKSAIAWTLYYLCQDRYELAKLQSEVDRVLNGRTATFEDIPNLPKVKNSILEGLRLRPVVPGIDRTTANDTILGGHFIPKGTTMYMNWHAAHTDPTLWENPEAFFPDRFDDNPGYAKNFFAFSYTPRNCIGQKFGMNEAIIVTASLIQKFDVQMGDCIVRPSIVIAQEPVGFKCKFIPR